MRTTVTLDPDVAASLTELNQVADQLDTEAFIEKARARR
jgi:hypothetical protein